MAKTGHLVGTGTGQAIDVETPLGTGRAWSEMLGEYTEAGRAAKLEVLLVAEGEGADFGYRIARVAVTRADGRDVTDTDLRSWPLATVSVELQRRFQWVPAENVGALYRAMPDVRPRRQTLTDEFLAEVARVYADAVCAGRSPRHAIRARWGIATSTAANWAAMARREGMLTEAPGRQAGGDLTDRARALLGLETEGES